MCRFVGMMTVASLSATVVATALTIRSAPTITIAPGVEMPYVSLGTGSGQKGDVANATALWIGAGGVGIDTAYDYQDQKEIAKGIAAAGAQASDLFITTKIPCGSYERAKSDIESNLQELGVQKVDLILIHFACESQTQTSGTWKALEEAKESGQTRAIGVSHFSKQDIDALDSVPAINQCLYSVEQHDDETIDYCKSKGITYMSFSPLCGGANGSSCSMRGGKSVLTVPEVQQIGKVHNVSPAQIALKWIVQRDSPIACASWRQDYMKEDLDLWSWGNLTEPEMEKLNTLHSLEL